MVHRRAHACTRPQTVHAQTTQTGLFYKDYAGDYMERFYWLFPHSSLSVSLFFLFSFFQIYMHFLYLLVFLSGKALISLPFCSAGNVSKWRIWESRLSHINISITFFFGFFIAWKKYSSAFVPLGTPKL